MGYNWHWKVLLETEPGGTGSYIQYLIVGLGWTLVTALAAWVIALSIGALVGYNLSDDGPPDAVAWQLTGGVAGPHGAHLGVVGRF